MHSNSEIYTDDTERAIKNVCYTSEQFNAFVR